MKYLVSLMLLLSLAGCKKGFEVGKCYKTNSNIGPEEAAVIKVEGKRNGDYMLTIFVLQEQAYVVGVSNDDLLNQYFEKTPVYCGALFPTNQ